ncbi:MAG: DUF655 domain-containing protein [Candidatus Parvarchaeota archaeon]|nr:DUF655 domain-containing protein [Candidatus Parvarchaeota archaeon]
MGKDEYAYVLEYFPYGMSDSKDRRPSAIVLTESLSLLLVSVKKEGKIEVGKKVYIGEGKREDIHHIITRVPLTKVNERGKELLNDTLDRKIIDDEKRFVDIINRLGPINVKLHSLELIPGIGSKTLQRVLDERKKSPFTSYDDINKRAELQFDIRKSIRERILSELNEADKYRIFT